MTHDKSLIFEKTISTVPRLLSIVVAAYNHEAFVSECLDSILACTRLDDVEIIVIDDGSPDNTLAVVEQTLSAANVNCRIFSKLNKGLTDSLELGLQLATGKYISFIASDDTYLPDGLTSCLDELAAFVDIDQAILFQGEMFGTLTGPIYARATDNLFKLHGSEFLKAISLEYPRPMLLQTTIFGTAYLRSISPWSDRLGLDDWPTFIKVAQHVASGAGSFRYDPSISLCRYRVHNSGIHTNLDRQLAVCLEVVDRVVDPIFRTESRANVYIDRSLNYLSRGNVKISLKLLWKGLRENPSARTFLRAPRKILRKAFG